MADRSNGHLWIRDRCTHCGTVREEAWFLDDGGDPVMALVWTSANGRIRVRPFPPMLGMDPPVMPTTTLAELPPSIPIGGEPACQGALGLGRRRPTGPPTPPR